MREKSIMVLTTYPAFFAELHVSTGDSLTPAVHAVRIVAAVMTPHWKSNVKSV